MLSAERYVEVVREAIDGIALAATGNLAAPVEHCPGFDVAELLRHTGGFCRVIAARVRSGTNVDASGNWRDPAASDVGDPIDWHLRCGRELLDALAAADPGASAETWAGTRTKGFQFRRAAHELVVHRFDAEHARTGSRARSAIAADIAADGADELLGEFGSRVAARFGGSGDETFLFTCDDSPYVAHVTVRPDRLDVVREPLPANVRATATAAELLLFLWGRKPPSVMRVDGDRSLLDNWHERVRI